MKPSGLYTEMQISHFRTIHSYEYFNIPDVITLFPIHENETLNTESFTAVKIVTPVVWKY